MHKHAPPDHRERMTDKQRKEMMKIILERDIARTNVRCEESRRTPLLHTEDVIDFQIAGTGKIQKSFGTLRKRPE